MPAQLDADVRGPGADQRRIDDRGERQRIVQGAPYAHAVAMQLLVELEPVEHEPAERGVDPLELGILWRLDQDLHGHVEPDHRDRNAAGEHQPKRLRVAEGVEFGRRDDLALAVEHTAHPDQLA